MQKKKNYKRYTFILVLSIKMIICSFINEKHDFFLKNFVRVYGGIIREEMEEK